MRIIAGIAKGRKLLSPHNQGRVTEKGDINATRPTLDRVKESMFSIISGKIQGARILDMFSGTGSLGLESISRGADSAVMVEKSRETYDILTKNIENLGFSAKSTPILSDSYEYCKKAGYKGDVFDIIFVDPPYLNNMVKTSVLLVEELGLLSSTGVIVSKYDVSEEIYEPEGSLELVDRRKYGKTVIAFYQYRKEHL